MVSLPRTRIAVGLAVLIGASLVASASQGALELRKRTAVSAALGRRAQSEVRDTVLTAAGGANALLDLSL